MASPTIILRSSHSNKVAKMAVLVTPAGIPTVRRGPDKSELAFAGATLNPAPGIEPVYFTNSLGLEVRDGQVTWFCIF